MKNINVLNAAVILQLAEIYGIDYLKDKIKDCWYGVCEEEKTCKFIYLLEGSKGNSANITNKRGWKVYATIEVDKETLETSVIECVLPLPNKN